MLGATDSRHYHAISDRVYRFTPIISRKDDLPRIHGINERLSIDNMHKWCFSSTASFSDGHRSTKSREEMKTEVFNLRFSALRK